MLNLPYPLTIIADRYSGSYSGAAWTAWNKYPDDLPVGPENSDIGCHDFWADYKHPVGKGATPDAALADLIRQLDAAKGT